MARCYVAMGQLDGQNRAVAMIYQATEYLERLIICVCQDAIN